jgi:hypothetical protein
MTADATRIGIGLAGVKANDHRIREHLVITLLEAVKERDAPRSCRIAEMSNSRATGKMMRRMKGIVRVRTAPVTASNRSVPGHLVSGSRRSHQKPVCSKGFMSRPAS